MDIIKLALLHMGQKLLVNIGGGGWEDSAHIPVTLNCYFMETKFGTAIEICLFYPKNRRNNFVALCK